MSQLLIRLLCLTCLALMVTGRKKKHPPAASPYALVDQQLPKISVQSLEERPVKLTAMKNTPTVLALWATWCEPCHEEIPALVEWSKKERGTRLVTLAVEDSSVDVGDLRAFLTDADVDGPAYFTTPGNASALGVRALPVVYVIDEIGVVRAVHEGFEGVDQLLSWVEAAVNDL